MQTIGNAYALFPFSLVFLRYGGWQTKNLRQPAIHGLQTRAVPSLLPDTIAMPSVDQASVVTVPRCPSNSQVGPQFFLHFPTTTSQ